MILPGRDKMLDCLSIDSKLSNKVLVLKFHICAGPQGNVLYRHGDVINASSIGGSCFWVLLGVLPGN